MSGKKKCSNCKAESVYCTGGRCPPCFRHFMDYNVERPLPSARPALSVVEKQEELPVAEQPSPRTAPLDPEESLRFVLGLYKDTDAVRKALEAQLAEEKARADKLAEELEREKADSLAIVEKLQAAEDKVKELEDLVPKKPDVSISPDLQAEISSLFAGRQQG